MTCRCTVLDQVFDMGLFVAIITSVCTLSACVGGSVICLNLVEACSSF